MTNRLIDTVRAAMAGSELIRAVTSVRADGGLALALSGAETRPLGAEEIVLLEGAGNWSADWSQVRVAEGFDWRRVRHSSFHGQVVLGRFARAVRLGAGVELPSGVFHSTVVNSVIGNDALVRDVKLLANYVIGEAALVSNCGTVATDDRTTFGNGMALPLGLESGGRPVRAYAEISVEVASALALAGAHAPIQEAYNRALADYVVQAGSSRGIIERGAAVCDTPEVRNTYLGPHGQVRGATRVAESTLLSSAEEPVQVLSGSLVHNSLLQWGSRVSALAVVEQSVLTEHAHAERHGKVSGSVVGPNSGVATGEVTASLLGPFVGFHHQALLIAVLWPEGKGNVSQGANVGSNHTSRAPDQECRLGEGMFIGLGANVKFPADFSRAPHSVIACGITTLPQRVLFPFSLINAPSGQWPAVSPAFNEIVPAWVLAENLYALRRNEAKYRARNKARRSTFSFEVFRPETVDLMRDACRRLEAVATIKEVYTDRDVDGLGKNYLREAHRLRAIEAYRFHVRFHALVGLKTRLHAVLLEKHAPAVDGLLASPSLDDRWEQQRRILVEDFGARDIGQCLRELPGLFEQVALEVERSKFRDDERGRRIFTDYAEFHAPANQDPFVQQTWAETRRLQAEVSDLLARLEQLRAAKRRTSRLDQETTVNGRPHKRRNGSGQALPSTNGSGRRAEPLREPF
jgi:hypothetical protein